jgi:hypothetical protein
MEMVLHVVVNQSEDRFLDNCSNFDVHRFGHISEVFFEVESNGTYHVRWNALMIFVALNMGAKEIRHALIYSFLHPRKIFIVGHYLHE